MGCWLRNSIGHPVINIAPNVASTFNILIDRSQLTPRIFYPHLPVHATLTVVDIHCLSRCFRSQGFNITKSSPLFFEVLRCLKASRAGKTRTHPIEFYPNKAIPRIRRQHRNLNEAPDSLLSQQSLRYDSGRCVKMECRPPHGIVHDVV